MTTIGIIGGTGAQGRGLGYRFARAGHDVILGSRSEERAQQAAEEIQGRLIQAADGAVSGAGNLETAGRCDLAVLAVPWAGHREAVAEFRQALDGKVVVSCVNPLGFDRQGPYALSVTEGSAAEQAAAELPTSRIVGAFHHVSAVTLLKSEDLLVHEDVLVCGDDAEAKAEVCELAKAITGRPGVDSGPLRLAHQLEAMTAVLLAINKRYKARAGISISGLP